MNSDKREQLLKIVAAAAAGLWLFNLLVIDPAIKHWKEQGMNSSPA